jgi:hypothetical protein
MSILDVTPTPELVRTEPAGSRLNFWVAETLGWKVEEAGEVPLHGRTWFIINPAGEKICRTPWPDDDLKTYFPDWSGKIKPAWKLVRAMRDEVFSRRQKFYRQLQAQVTRELSTSSPVAWPDVMGHIGPAMICRAFIIARWTRERQTDA